MKIKTQREQTADQIYELLKTPLIDPVAFQAAGDPRQRMIEKAKQARRCLDDLIELLEKDIENA